MADERGSTGAGFGLTFVEGRGVLGLEGRPLPFAGRVDSLQMEIPRLRFPFDMSGGTGRFANRQCHLRELVVSCGEADLAAFLKTLPLADFGILDAELQIDRGCIQLGGRAVFGEREAEFTATGALRRVRAEDAGTGSDVVRLSFFDIRVYGFLPVPAALVATAVFTALGARPRAVSTPADGAPGAGPAPLVTLAGAADLDIAALDLALLGLLPAQGWRLPRRDGVRLSVATGEARRLRLGYVAGTSDPLTAALTPELALHEDGVRRFAEAEVQLAAGELPPAVHAYRRGVKQLPDDRFAAMRLLQVLTSSPSTLADADELANIALDRWPDFVPALLAKAIIASEDRRHSKSAQAFEELAEQAAGAGRISDQAAALAAAAEQRLLGTQPASSTQLLERALTIKPRHRGVLRAFSRRLAAEERWTDLLRVLRQRAVDEPTTVGRAPIYAQIGFVLLDRLKDPTRARDRFEQAVRLHDREATAWEGLGRTQAVAGDGAGATASLDRARAIFAAAGDRAGEARTLMALADVDRSSGNEDAAIERLRHAAEMDAEAWEPLLRAAEIAAAERPRDALALLQSALDRTRHARVKALILRKMAAVSDGGLGDRVAARVLLERGLAESAADVDALEDLSALLESQGDFDDAEAFLRRGLDDVRDREGQRRLLGRLRDVARRTKDEALLAEALEGLAAGGGAGAADAAAELVELAGERGDKELASRAAGFLEAALSQGRDGDEGGSSRAAQISRLARLRESQGDDAAALGWWRKCTEVAEGPLAILAWRHLAEISERTGDFAGAAQAWRRLADDARTAEGPEARTRHLVTAADLLRERLGQPQEAQAVLERALALEEGPGPDRARLVPVLERLGALQVVDLGRPQQAEITYRRLIGIEPDHQQANLWLARLAWGAGHVQESARHYQRVLALGGETEGARVDTAEAALRLAQWARVVGQSAEAKRYLSRGLQRVDDPRAGAPLGVLTEVMEGLARVEDLLDILRRRQQAASEPRVQQDTERALAGVLERVGRSGEAVAIYQRHLEQERDNRAVLLRLAEIFRRESLPTLLADILARLLELAEAAKGTSAHDDAETIAIELAALYRDALGQPERAEALLRRVSESDPGATDALEMLSELLWARGAFEEADATLARRVVAEADPASGARLLMERVRLRLSGPGGQEKALALLQELEPRTLGREALSMRADLAEKTGDIPDAILCLRALRVLMREKRTDGAGVRAVEGRLGALLLRRELNVETTIEGLHELLATDQTSAFVASGLLKAYARLPDRRARNRGWADLLGRAQGLTDVQRAKIHVALAEAAEQDADFLTAEAELRAALSVDGGSVERADQLVSHARVSIVLKAVEDARADLEEALLLVPAHRAGLLLSADFAYRNQDWEQARRYYNQLAAVPSAKDVIAPTLLAFRRAELAEMFGDENEAESAYGEVASLDARHIEAREALAQMALVRENRPVAARWLEELLSLYPGDATEKVVDARQRLGEIKFHLGDAEEARRHLEMVLLEDPDRVPALESMVGVYQKLDLHREAAEVCRRLSRLYPNPSQRAEALYRQGEILRSALGDEQGAGAAYLKSSDLDPTFAPTLGRLVHYYWREGDFANLAEVGAELLKQRKPGDPVQDDLGLLVAIGMLLGPAGEAAAGAALSPYRASLMPDRLAARLDELAFRLGPQGADRMEGALALVLDGAPARLRPDLVEALCARVMADPTATGSLAVLGRLTERQEPSLARAAYSLLLFLDPEVPVGERLGRLGVALAPSWKRLAAGAFEHRSAAGPFRRVMAALARLLVGFPGLVDGDRSPAVEARPHGRMVDVIDDLRQRLALPSYEAVLREGRSGVAVEHVRPEDAAFPILRVVVGQHAVELPAAEMTFLAARALEDCRVGTFALTGLTPKDLPDFLGGIARALGADGAALPRSSGELGAAVATWLAEEERAALLPRGQERKQLVADLRELLENPPDLERYALGCQYTADRLGLLMSGSPLAALRATLGVQRAPSASKTDPLLPVAGATSVERREQVRTVPALAELVSYLFSADYRALLGS